MLRARRGPKLGHLGAVRRSLADMALSIGAVIVAIIWVQGLGVLLGPSYAGLVGEPTPPTQIVPILLLALGVDYAIHTHGRYREELVATPTRPVDASARLGSTVGVALTLSMITTGIGFLTNLASPLPAIQDLGITAAVGIFCVLVTILTIVVAGRTLLDRRAERRGLLAVDEIAPSEASPFARVATVGLRPALRAPVAVLAVTGAVTVASLVGFTQLETEFSATDFLPDGDPSKAAVVALEDSFDGGLGETTDVLVTGDGVLSPEVHNATIDVADRLVDEVGIVQRLGRPDMVTPSSELELAQNSARSDEQTAAVAAARAAGLLADGTIALDGDVATIYSEMASAFPTVSAVVDLGGGADDGPSGPAIRLSVLTQSEAFGVETVVNALDSALVPLLDTGVEAIATSDAIITDQTTTAMSDSSVSGLLITLTAVTALLALVYGLRSGQAGLGALVVAPVAAVVLNTFGLMWIFGIPFDPITAIMSSLVVGVGVDFCIHLGERFVEDLEVAEGDIAAALGSALRHTGAALAGSATTTTLGFAVLLFGSILPFQRLGLVTIFAMILSLLAVVFVLPAALVLYGRKVSSRPVASSDEQRLDSDVSQPSPV
ncbi:MAG: MMPL family transporter [Actinomycetota bacterium]